MNFKKFGLMLDCSRNSVLNVKTVKEWIDLMSDLGYNALLLYTEDTYEVKGQPNFGYLRGRYTAEEIKEIDKYAIQKGVELIPCIQTLAHLNAIYRWKEYEKIRDIHDILMVGEEETYALIEDMFKSLSENFTSRIVNIGMDEAHALGKGRYYKKNGFVEEKEIFLSHLNRVCKIAEKYNFEVIVWGDMFMKISGNQWWGGGPPITDEIRALVPNNAEIVYWDYYATSQEKFSKRMQLYSTVKQGIWYAGGAWTWRGFSPYNKFSINSIIPSLKAAEENNVDKVIYTLWGDNGAECSKYTMLPSIYTAAAYVKGITDMDEIKKGFEEKFGIAFDEFMLLDLPDTANDFGCGTEHTDNVNPEKYMLYNDLLLGTLDSTVAKGDGERYLKCAEKLEKNVSHEKYGYLFKTLADLCRVHSEKIELGYDIYWAYKNNDKEELAVLRDRCLTVVELVDKFFNSLKTQWYNESKPFGFDVQDIRWGGLKQRVLHCHTVLDDYINGRIETIEELDVKNPIELKGTPIIENNWQTTVSINVI